MSQHHNLPESAQTTDPEFAELVEYFLDELPNRIRELEDASDSADLSQLRLYAHRLKGCASGFGFPEVGSRAAQIESSIDRSSGVDTEIESIRSEVGELTALCRSYFRND